MELHEKIKYINHRDDLCDFINLLKLDFLNNPDDWENGDIKSFLEAMSVWMKDMDSYYASINEPFNEELTWKRLADILYASKLYE